MKVRECAYCKRAIWGSDYYSGIGGYYHKDCPIPDGSGTMGKVTMPWTNTAKFAGGGGKQEDTVVEKIYRRLIALEERVYRLEERFLKNRGIVKK